MWGVGGLLVHQIHHNNNAHNNINNKNNNSNNNNSNNNTVSATRTQEKSISSPHCNRSDI